MVRTYVGSLCMQTFEYKNCDMYKFSGLILVRR